MGGAPEQRNTLDTDDLRTGDDMHGKPQSNVPADAPRPLRCWQHRDRDTLYLSRKGFCNCPDFGVINRCRLLT